MRGFISLLLQRQVCFAVIAAQSFGEILDYSVVFHENDLVMVRDTILVLNQERKMEHQKLRKVERERNPLRPMKEFPTFLMDCYSVDLMGSDFLDFKRQYKEFVEQPLKGRIGWVYELREQSFKHYRDVITHRRTKQTIPHAAPPAKDRQRRQKRTSK